MFFPVHCHSLTLSHKHPIFSRLHNCRRNDQETVQQRSVMTTKFSTAPRDTHGCFSRLHSVSTVSSTTTGGSRVTLRRALETPHSVRAQSRHKSSIRDMVSTARRCLRSRWRSSDATRDRLLLQHTTHTSMRSTPATFYRGLFATPTSQAQSVCSGISLDCSSCC